MGANRTDEHTDRWTDGQHQPSFNEIRQSAFQDMAPDTKVLDI